jgi:hypothetical protein
MKRGVPFKKAAVNPEAEGWRVEPMDLDESRNACRQRQANNPRGRNIPLDTAFI